MSNRLSPLPGTVHYLADEIHYRYDNSLAPALTIDAGDTVTFVCREACDGQFTRESTTEVLDHRQGLHGVLPRQGAGRAVLDRRRPPRAR
jgi:hypothetical protein